jgi:hypothetical protein
MSAATEFHAHIRYRYNSHLFRVFFSKECQGSCGNGFGHGLDFGPDGKIAEYNIVDVLFDFSNFAVREGREMGVVESQPIGSDQGPCLFDVSANDIPQGGLKNVCSRVIGGDPPSPVNIDFRLNFITNMQCSVNEFRFVNDNSTNGRERIEDSTISRTRPLRITGNS